MGRLYPDPVRLRHTRMEAPSRFWGGFAGGVMLGASLLMQVGCSQDDVVQKFPHLRSKLQQKATSTVSEPANTRSWRKQQIRASKAPTSAIRWQRWLH